MEKLFKEQPTIYNPNGDIKNPSSPVMSTDILLSNNCLRVSSTMIDVRWSSIAAISSFFYVPQVATSFSRTVLFQGLNQNFQENSPRKDDVYDWGRIDDDGEFASYMNKEDPVRVGGSCEVRVVSFELDDTLWETGPTIQAANNALAVFLGENNIIQPYQVEFIMEKLFKEQPTIYNPNGDIKNPSSPVMLTQLRKDAVQKLLIESNRFSEDEANIFADSAFQVWSEARHRSISQNLVPNAIECLDNIQSLRAASDKPVVIGAITDGNS
eukprot:CAMPEP_0194197396 /NCGR_PEP_ID=MMETSP0154-20130528/77177_1 /TAXON_ID=1049557 /ORGANISM="Thalassiothrix antarctica, Strain L6-D1" /LENGTH=268 /DNA_ID=CAMNT_0038922057 /DNA_START=467 /DNA_END=1269 /DNA_ORIENTATION=-